jgi:hypothetical protein
MMQQLQSRYVMEKPEKILYGTDNGLTGSSEAFLNGDWKKSKLYVQYPGDLRVWVNGNATEHWKVEVDGAVHDLPPYGWLALQGVEFFESSELVDGSRCDRVSSSSYVFLDGRGVSHEFAGISSSGSLAVKPLDGKGLLLIAVEGVDQVRLSKPDTMTRLAGDVRSLIAEAAAARSLKVEAFDADGLSLGPAKTSREDRGWTIASVPEALRYELKIAE